MAQGEDESDRDFDGFGPPAGPMLSHRSDPVGIYPAVWDENFTTRNQLSIDSNRQVHQISSENLGILGIVNHDTVVMMVYGF